MRALRFRPGIKKIPKKGRTVNFGKKFNKNEVFLRIGIYIWRLSAKKCKRMGFFIAMFAWKSKIRIAKIYQKIAKVIKKAAAIKKFLGFYSSTSPVFFSNFLILGRQFFRDFRGL